MPDLNIDRKMASLTITQKIYNLAHEVIDKYPEQWEAWIYLHKVSKIINRIQDPIQAPDEKSFGNYISFNSKQYGVFKILNEKYLFDKYSYLSYLINDEIYNSLAKGISRPIKKNLISKEVFKQLSLHKVVLPA